MMCLYRFLYSVFFFNDTATTEIYTLSLHDALPISTPARSPVGTPSCATAWPPLRSEEHTSELQSRRDLVCRLLLEKKKQYNQIFAPTVNTHGERAINQMHLTG